METYRVARRGRGDRRTVRVDSPKFLLPSSHPSRSVSSGSRYDPSPLRWGLLLVLPFLVPRVPPPKPSSPVDPSFHKTFTDPGGVPVASQARIVRFEGVKIVFRTTVDPSFRPSPVSLPLPRRSGDRVLPVPETEGSCVYRVFPFALNPSLPL